VHDDNPYAAPKFEVLSQDRHLETPDEAWRDGKTLVTRKGAELPDRCIKCNAPAGGYRFSRNLSWHSSGWYLLIFISLLIYILAYFLVRWRGKVTVGLCERHRIKRKRAIILGWLTALTGIGLNIAAISFSGDPASTPSPLVPIGFVGGLVLLLAGLIGGMLGSQVLVPSRIDKHFVWLRKVSPDYLAELPDWNV
jgi:hypothetical protein